MSLLIDKLILLLLCAACLPFARPNAACAAAFLSAVTVSALCAVCQKERCAVLLLLAYCTALAFLPEFSLFLPLIAYDFLPAFADESTRLCQRRVRRPFFLRTLPPLCAAAALIFLSWRSGTAGGEGLRPALSVSWPFLTAALCVPSVLLRFRTNCCIALHEKLLRTRDDDTEVQLLLEERNHSLLEKQDAEIYTATLRERNRIAREIHDNVGHMLTRSILMVGALRTVHSSPELLAPLEQLGDTLNQAMNSIRESVHDLHDSSVSLPETLALLARDFTFCPVTLDCDISPELPREVCFCFIAIVKEALVNISRHSNATRAEIKALEHPGFYQLIVKDNGSTAKSFDADAFFGHSDGIGLQNIRSRVRALNGTVHFDTASGFGICVFVPRKT